jgi:hypothetical protein
VAVDAGGNLVMPDVVNSRVRVGGLLAGGLARRFRDA